MYISAFAETERGDKSLRATKQMKYFTRPVLLTTNRAHNVEKVE